MARYRIQYSNDPRPFKKQILEFWDEYLPGTPHGRFEWMCRGNPAGPAIWFFAFDDNSQELAGVLSVMPKDIFLKGESLRAGIAGDFMVPKKHRLFGPNLMLPKEATTKMHDLNMTLLYTVPNASGEKVVQRAGFVKSGVVCFYVKPLDMNYYLGKYVHPSVSILVGPLVNAFLRMASRELFTGLSCIFEETALLNGEFDELWEKVRASRPRAIGDHSVGYLQWRYFQNPQYDFRVLACREPRSLKLLGYVVFTVSRRKLHIFDVLSLNDRITTQLIKKVISLARRERCLSVNVELLESNPLVNKIKPFAFFRADTSVSLFACGDKKETPEFDTFICGDRNI